MVTTKLYIGNIPENHNATELRQTFEKYGKVVEFDILQDYGFVHYENETEAKSAVDALDGVNHRGQALKVEISRSRVRQRPGMGGRGECYRCGGDGHWSKECPKGPSRGRGAGGRNRDRNGDDFRRGGAGGYGSPYYSDPYDYYSRRPPAPHPYDRLRYDPYERRVPPAMPPRDYYGFSRDAADYYRRSSPTRDPYYDMYMKRRYEGLERYGDVGDRAAGASSMTGKEDIKQPLMRTPMQSRIPGRVPGPY